MFEQVEFQSEGATLRGRLYPAPSGQPAPIVVMGHGFGATITMVADRFAEVFQAGGLAVLLYDHFGFGSSDGEPRRTINHWLQARGYRAAIDYASTRTDVGNGRLGIWGDSMTGAVSLVVAGVDDRVEALVVQVPATGSAPAPADPDGKLFEALRDTLLHGDILGGPDDRGEVMPVVSPDQGAMPSLLLPIQAYRWFIDYGGRFGTLWENNASRVVPKTPAPFHAGLAAPFITCPTFFQIAPGDEMQGANPEVSRGVFDLLGGSSELQEIDGGHFGLLYYPGELFDQVSGAQRDFLLRHLT